MAESNNRLLVKVASPEGLAFSAAAMSLTLQTTDGVIQILPGHADIITTLEAGEMVIVDEKQEEIVFALGEGFALVGSNVITIVANFAEDEIFNEDEVERARSNAEAALRSAATMTGQEREAQEFLLRRSTVQLQVFRSRKKNLPIR